MKKLLTLFAIVILQTVAIGQPVTPAKGIEPTAGTWNPWVIPSGNAFRIPPPPKGEMEQAEIKEIISLQSKIDSASMQQIKYWDVGSPSYRWQSMYDQLLDSSQYAFVFIRW